MLWVVVGLLLIAVAVVAESYRHNRGRHVDPAIRWLANVGTCVTGLSFIVGGLGGQILGGVLFVSGFVLFIATMVRAARVPS